MERQRSYASLMAELHGLCAARRTGTLMIVAENNSLAQFVLERGDIVSVTCRGRRGQEAFEAIRQMTTGRARFHEGASLAPKVPLPSTPEVLMALGAGKVEDLRLHVETGSVSSQEVQVPVPTRPRVVLTPAVQAVLESNLAMFIGPMATLVCADHLAHAHSLDEAIAALAKEIENPEMARRFEAAVRRSV